MKRRISQGAGDAVDFRPRPGDPDGAAARVPLWNLVGGNGRQLRLCPTDLPAFKCFGSDAVVAQPGGRTFADLLAFLADDYDGLAGETTRPVLDVAMGAAACARNQARVCREVVVDADIDQRRRVGRANQS
jgi:hypothetical protein